MATYTKTRAPTPGAARVPAAQTAPLRQFYATHPYKHLQVGKAGWAYIACGQGTEALLILPGGTRAGYPFWIVPDFEQAYRIIMPVYPLVATLTELSEGLAAILQAEGIERVHVLGSSLGGIVAQCFARRYPDKVDRVILANTGAPDPAGIPGWQLRRAVLRMLPAGLVKTLFQRQVFHDLGAVPAADLPLLRAYTTTMIRRTPPAWFRHSFALLIDFAEHYQGVPSTPGTPGNWQNRVLILDSDADTYYPRPKREALYALYPQARVHTFAAGHIVSLSHRQEYTSVIRQFLHGAAVGLGAAQRIAADTAVLGAEYYLARQPALLKTFDRAATRVRPVLGARLGLPAAVVSELIGEAREEYAQLILQLPYIGGKQNPLTWNLEGAAMFLAIYRVLQRHGKTAGEVGPLMYEITERWYAAYPGWLLRLLGRLRFSRVYRQRMQRRAAESQQRRYPGDWVYSYVEGDGKTFDFGVDYTECGICKFYHVQGADEFTPYLCPLDYIMSRALGSGIERTTTLADGAARCDFRFKHSRATPQLFDAYYRDVPAAQASQLRRFRATHVPKHLTVTGRNWQYIACGHGTQCLVLLPGGLQIGDPFFRLILALEDQYRLIVPWYPPVATLEQLIDGLKAIFDTEGIAQADVLGTSLGGMLAQCFVRRYPERVSKLILGDTTVPAPRLGRRFQVVSKVVARLPLPLLKRLALRRFAAYTALAPDEERAFWRAYFAEYTDREWTRTRINTQYNCLTDFCLHYSFTPSDLEGWPGTVLIIEAEDDPLIKADLRAALRATYPQAQIYTFAGGGHIPGITRQTEYLAVIRSFLAGLPLPAAPATAAPKPEAVTTQAGVKTPATARAYYLARRPHLLKAFDKTIKQARPVLAEQLGYDAATLTSLIADVRAEYARLIPELPYIGGQQNRLSWNLEESALFLALYRALHRRGKDPAEVGQLVYALTDYWYNRYPRWLARLIGRSRFSRWYTGRLQQWAARSQRRRYPGDFVYQYIPGDGKTFDFGVDYTACAICRFYHAQGADEFMPYLCPLDYAISAAFGLGMVRTTTLAEGGPRCDFRFQHGRPTRLRWPVRSVSVLDSSEEPAVNMAPPVDTGAGMGR